MIGKKMVALVGAVVLAGGLAATADAACKKCGKKFAACMVASKRACREQGLKGKDRRDCYRLAKETCKAGKTSCKIADPCSPSGAFLD